MLVLIEKLLSNETYGLFLTSDIKCVVIGDGAVGKTCLLVCYVQGSFPTNHVPTVFDNWAQNIVFEGQSVNLLLWDTAGQEDYAQIRPMTYRDTNVFIICFSLISPTSLENVVLQWKPEVENSDGKYAEIILVGTKSDLRDEFDALPADKKQNGERPITPEEAKIVANQIGATHYIECSAKNGTGLTDVFHTAMRSVLNPKQEKEIPVKKFGCELL